MPFKCALFGLVMLAACGTLPRGAGLQGEVLAHRNETVKGSDVGGAEPLPSQFAVEPITRDNLARYARWPVVGETSFPWVKRVDQPDGQIIAAGDMITITIWNTEENGLLGGPGQRVVNIPASQLTSTGQVYLPYIGPLKLSGMSPEHARGVVEQAYKKVVPSAQVQLNVTSGRQSTASIVDGVVHPGAFPLPDQDVTLLDLVAQSGGIIPSIVNPQVRLQRGSKTYSIAFNRVLTDTSLNTTLTGGDRIIIQPDERYFLSLGASGTRASHGFPREDVTALDALSIIGGLAAERANAQGILVLRSYPDKAVRSDGSGPRHMRTIFTLDLTSADGLFSAGQFQIRNGDLIYVTESPLIGTRNVFGVIGSIFGLARQGAILTN